MDSVCGNDGANLLFGGNGHTLLNTQVDQLIQATANVTATSGVSGDQALDNPALVPAVQNILAANWQ